MPENMDFVGNGKGQGEVAQLLLTQGRLDPSGMRPFLGEDGKAYVSVYIGGDRNKPTSYRNREINVNATTLRRDEWKQLDEAVIPIAESRLNGIQDLISNGLTYNLGNAMGTTVLEQHDISDAMEAALTMDGVTRSPGDRPVYGVTYLPIPIIHVDYEINARVLAASRNMGNPLDTTSAERAARKVAEKLEAMLFTNTTYPWGGGTIFSYLNYTHRNQVTLDTKWTTSGVTGATIVDDIRTMKQASLDAHFYGPWMLYVPSAYETLLDDDYTTGYPKTIRARILEIAGIKGIKVIDTLTADNILMVQMTSDVVRLVRGMGIQNIEWQTEGKFITKYKVITIQVPQLRADQDGHCGIVHATFTA
jgi:uncharacterized linocin/CFP29 family protein